MSELGTIAGLGGLALLAGLVDAVAGGGGLIQRPALLLCCPAGETTALAAVLGTNKFSSLCGTGLAAVQYTRQVPLNWVTLLPAAGAALVGSWLGARVVTRLDPALLRVLLLGLLVTVAGYTFARKDLGRCHAPRFSPRQERWLGVATGLSAGSSGSSSRR